jgi:hypothetical protein
MAEKAPCSCGCGKLVSASTDHRHRAGKTTPRAKATSRQSITATTTKFHSSRNNSPQRKRQRTNPDPLPPLEDQDRGAIHASESMHPPLFSLSPNHSETESIEPVVNPCAEAWTNASRYRATVEDADSDDESDGEEGGTPSSVSMDGRDSSLSDSESSDDGLGIEDTINDEFERELGNFGAYLNVPSLRNLVIMYRQLRSLRMKNLHTLGITPSRLKLRWQMTLFPNSHSPSPNLPLHPGKLQRRGQSFLQHSGQWHTTAAFHHVVALLVRTAICHIVLIAMSHVSILKVGRDDDSHMLRSSHGSRPSTKTKSLDSQCYIEVNINTTAPASRMLWTAQTISGFGEAMLPLTACFALTSTLKIIGTLLSASQPMDFAHFGSAKKPAGQS